MRTQNATRKKIRGKIKWQTWSNWPENVGNKIAFLDVPQTIRLSNNLYTFLWSDWIYCNYNVGRLAWEYITFVFYNVLSMDIDQNERIQTKQIFASRMARMIIIFPSSLNSGSKWFLPAFLKLISLSFHRFHLPSTRNEPERKNQLNKCSSGENKNFPLIFVRTMQTESNWRCLFSRSPLKQTHISA